MVEAQPNCVQGCSHSLIACGECKPRVPTAAQEIAELKEKLAAMERFLNVRNVPDATPAVAPAKPVKLDLGCGTMVRRNEMKNWTRELGWTGVDIQASDGADVVCDLGRDPWPWADSSVDETNCSHMLEHIPGKDVEWKIEDGSLSGMRQTLRKVTTYPRAHFMNELWRVLKPGAKATFVTPYWGSCRAYGDITHEWPPVGEMSTHYWDKEWRKTQAPHDNFYTCDFPIGGIGYAPGQHLIGRTPEFVNEAIRDHKEAAGDIMFTLVARK